MIRGQVHIMLDEQLTDAVVVVYVRKDHRGQQSVKDVGMRHLQQVQVPIEDLF